MKATMFNSEAEFVRWLRRLVGRPAARLRVGIGDDAAVVEVGRGRQLVLTSDLSIEGVHFTRALHPARSVGHRALARSLSDVAALGGTPRFALVSLSISPQISRAWVREFYGGLLALARRYKVELIGGDTAVVRVGIAADVVVAGEVARGRAVLRSGASPGDSLFVSGTLGLSALGFWLLKFSCRPSREGMTRKAIGVHLYPEPRCVLGRFLSKKRIASALIDVSDGFSIDLARLCDASGVGAHVWTERLPVTHSLPKVLQQASQPGRSPLARRAMPSALDLALHGGEDYELLFAVPPRKLREMPKELQGVSLHRVGEITRVRKLLQISAHGSAQPLPVCGFDHFRNKLR